MTTFVFEADILHHRWERVRHHFEVDGEKLVELLQEVGPDFNTLGVDPAILEDLLKTRGAATTFVEVGARRDEVIRLLEALSISAWKNAVPWQVGECEMYGVDDEKFDQYVRAYVKNNG